MFILEAQVSLPNVDIGSISMRNLYVETNIYNYLSNIVLMNLTPTYRQVSQNSQKSKREHLICSASSG